MGVDIGPADGGAMIDDPNERLAAFEAVLGEVRAEYGRTVAEMERLREAGRVRTVTYRQLTAEKIRLGETLDLYREHGIIDA